MMINLRPAYSDDYAFALNLYIEAIRPLASAWIEWVDADQKAQFASLWRPDHTRIITLDGREAIGWVEFRHTGDEIFLKQLLYLAQSISGVGLAHRSCGLLNEQRQDGKVDGTVRAEE